MKRLDFTPALIGYRTDIGRVAVALCGVVAKMDPKDKYTYRLRFEPLVVLYSLSFN